jgi:hypothetical protein
VAIVIREGPGFPCFCLGSYKSNKRDLSAWGQASRRPLGKGSVTVFDRNLVQEDLAVQGVGGARIFLLY